MNGKFWISGIVVTVLYFLLGWLFYGILMASTFMTAGTPGMRAEPLYGVIFLATLAYGFLMAYTFPIGYKGGTAGSEGMRFGILFALIIKLPSGLFMMAFSEGYTVKALVIGLIWEIIVGAVLGVITAKIYGSAAKAKA